jgi:tetratricopeptide (TPR) repeat protein
MFVQRKRTFAVFILLSTLSLPGEQANSRQHQLNEHTRLAQQYLKERRPDLAIPELQAVVALDPKDVDARGNLGVLLFFRGDYAGAAPELRAAVKMQPGLWKLQALLGMAERRMGDDAQGREDLEAAFPHLQEQKFKIQVGNNLLESYSSTGDLDKAAAVISQLRKLDPTNVSLIYSSYRIYSDLANEAMLTMALVAPGSAQMHQVMAHELARHDDTTAAIANYREALKIDPQLPGLHFELAELLSNSSDASLQAQAEAEYQAALAVNPFDEKAESRLGDLAAKRGDLKQAEADYTRALQLQPDDAETATDLAKVLLSMGQKQKAQALLQKAIQLDPTDYVAHYRLSALYRQEGQPDKAKQELEQYQKYKNMKEELTKIFHEMRVETGQKTPDDSDAKK